MSEMTEEEWVEVQEALVRGGIRECINSIIHRRAGFDEPDEMIIRINNVNRMLLYRAYDDGSGGTVVIVPSQVNGYFEGHYDGEYVMEGTEVNGTLFCICPQSGGGTVSVLVATEIVDNAAGTPFDSIPEARAYIRGLTAK